MIIGIEGDSYVFVPIEKGKLKNEPHKRKISDAESVDTTQSFTLSSEY